MLADLLKSNLAKILKNKSEKYEMKFFFFMNVTLIKLINQQVISFLIQPNCFKS
jgi:hypothetical protein